jgi:raffinose/stachyose/melibiose transport system substrate-binding protein
MKKKTLVSLMLVTFIFVLSVSALADDTLTIWHVYTTDSDGKQIVDQAVKATQEKFPNLKIVSSPMEDGAYKTKVQVAINSDELPDVFMSWGGGSLKKYVDADMALNLNSWLDENPDVADGFVSSTVFDPATFNGNVYGVPGHGIELFATYYNTEIFKKYDLEVPETYEDLKEVIKVLRENDIIPFALANQEAWPASFYYMYLVDRIGGYDAFQSVLNRTGGHFTDQPFVKAAEKIQELVDLGAFPNGFNGLKHGNAQDYMLYYSGKAAMTIQTPSFIPNMKNEAPSVYEATDIFTFPAVKGGEGNPNNALGSPGGSWFTVNKNTENKEAALEFLRNLSTEKAGMALKEAGLVPVQKGVEVEGRIPVKMKELFMAAPHIQTAYDQTLPPKLGSFHKESLQGVLDGSLTPEKMTKEWEDLAKEVYGEE